MCRGDPEASTGLDCQGFQWFMDGVDFGVGLLKVLDLSLDVSWTAHSAGSPAFTPPCKLSRNVLLGTGGVHSPILVSLGMVQLNSCLCSQFNYTAHLRHRAHSPKNCSQQGAEAAPCLSHPPGWITSAFAIEAGSTLFPRWGTLHPLLRATVSERQDQLSCSHDSRPALTHAGRGKGEGGVGHRLWPC